MKHLVFRLSAILAAAASLSCSSLLKLSVDTGKPLPEEDLSARVQTRGFYSEMSNIAVAAADTIAAHAPCDEIRIRALRWKIRFTRAAVTAVMQSIPEVAVADTWILCRTIDETFAAMPDSLLFGPLSPLARKAADSLHRRAEALARGAFNDKRYRRLERFVDICMTSLPEQVRGSSSLNTTSAWLDYLKTCGEKRGYTLGTIPEVMADMSDKINGAGEQMASSLGWSGEIMALRWRQDSLRDNLKSRLDSIGSYAGRTVSMLESLPQMSDEMIASIEKRLTAIMHALDDSMDDAFEQVDMQREHLQRFVAEQQNLLMQQTDTIVQHGIASASQAVPRIVNRIAAWTIIAAIVIFGMPFTAGFFVGSLTQRVRMRKKEK